MNNSFACHAIPNTPGPFLVDGFKLHSPSTQHYFLSHFHGDHYGGLKETFAAGVIYCTPTTRRLAINVLGVDPTRVIGIDFEQRTCIAGIYVTLFDANHCPGAALLQFELPNGTTHVHTGDFRFHPKMLQYHWKTPIDTIFLDTTYGKPKHVFLPQDEAIQLGVDTCLDASIRNNVPLHRTLFLIGAYNIGKEKLLLRIGKELNVKIGVEKKKMNGHLTCLYPQVDVREQLFTTNHSDTNVHVCRMNYCGEMWPFFRPNFVNMATFLEQMNQVENKYDHIVGIIPTGWAATTSWNREHAITKKDNATVVLISYSEHSSYEELISFAKGMKPRHIEPIVFSDANDRHAILNRFQAFVDRDANKRKFFSMMSSGGLSGGRGSGKRSKTKMKSKTKSNQLKLTENKTDCQDLTQCLPQPTSAKLLLSSSSSSSSSSFSMSNTIDVIDLSADTPPHPMLNSARRSTMKGSARRVSPIKKQQKLSFTTVAKQ
jgi:hypothetical protein